jgi:hypothetical protein
VFLFTTDEADPVPDVSGIEVFHPGTSSWIFPTHTLVSSVGTAEKDVIELKNARDCYNLNICLTATLKPVDLGVISRQKKMVRVDYSGNDTESGF